MDGPTTIGHNFWISAPAYLLLTMAAAATLEMLFPKRVLTNELTWRWSNNFAIGWLSYWLGTTAATYMMIYAASVAPALKIDLLGGGETNPWVAASILLATTQLLSYVSHWLFHHVPALWALHAVHHSDTDLDFSTSYRHHPLEPISSAALSIPLVLILGVEPFAAFIYQLFATTVTVFSHANIAIPQVLEKPLSFILITPDFHRVHHSSDPKFTNSNYGSLVPWFDYLFGTAKHWDDTQHKNNEIGLEYLREPRDSRLDRLLLTPFNIPKTGGSRPDKTDTH